MPSIDNPFREPKKFPSTRKALRALGVEYPEGGDGVGDKEAVKPLKLEMTDAERAIIEEAEKKAGLWNRAMLIKWASTFDKDEAWVDEMFEVRSGKIVYKEITQNIDKMPDLTKAIQAAEKANKP